MLVEVIYLFQIAFRASLSCLTPGWAEPVTGFCSSRLFPSASQRARE